MSSSKKSNRGAAKRVRRGLYTGGVLMVIAPTGLASCSSSDTSTTTTPPNDASTEALAQDGQIGVAPCMNCDSGKNDADSAADHVIAVASPDGAMMIAPAVAPVWDSGHDDGDSSMPDGAIAVAPLEDSGQGDATTDVQDAPIGIAPTFDSGQG
jgi:hypothetical protein